MPQQSRPIRILGIPMDLGQQRRGVDMGPSALRYAGLYERLARLGCQVEDAGNVAGAGARAARRAGAQWIEARSGGLRHLPEVMAACQAIYDVAQTCSGTPETARSFWAATTPSPSARSAARPAPARWG